MVMGEQETTVIHFADGATLHVQELYQDVLMFHVYPQMGEEEIDALAHVRRYLPDRQKVM
jgi:hypothetical protein